MATVRGGLAAGRGRRLGTGDAARAMADFAYASCLPVAGTDGRAGIVFEAAAATPIAAAVIDRIASVLGASSATALRYADAVRGQRRQLAVEGSGAEARIAAFVLAGPASLADGCARSGRSKPRRRRSAGPCSPPALPPRPGWAGAAQPADLQLLRCLGSPHPHRLRRPRRHAGLRLQAVQKDLRCGTQCGSCLPELRRLEGEVRVATVSLH